MILAQRPQNNYEVDFTNNLPDWNEKGNGQQYRLVSMDG